MCTAARTRGPAPARPAAHPVARTAVRGPPSSSVPAARAAPARALVGPAVAGARGGAADGPGAMAACGPVGEPRAEPVGPAGGDVFVRVVACGRKIREEELNLERMEAQLVALVKEYQDAREAKDEDPQQLLPLAVQVRQAREKNEDIVIRLEGLLANEYLLDVTIRQREEEEIRRRIVRCWESWKRSWRNG